LKILKFFSFGFSLLYCSLYLPLILIIYFSFWYSFNFRFHKRYLIIGKEYAENLINELINFFWHKGQLNAGWSQKERIHLTEVRNILDMILIIAIVCTIIIFLFFRELKPKLSFFFTANVLFILILFLIVPFFKLFWVKLFHPLLFRNNLWRNSFKDLSYYILPGIVFRNSIIYLLSSSLSINAVSLFITRKKKRFNEREIKV